MQMVKPEQALEELIKRVAPEKAASQPPIAGPTAVDGPDDNPIQANISATYHQLRRGMIQIAVAFPIILVTFVYFDLPGLLGPDRQFSGGLVYDLFVAMLLVGGTWLILSRGNSMKDNWLLNLAGSAIIFVALLLMAYIGIDIPGSLSAYYHFQEQQARNFFVGVLFAVGSLLILYKGYSKKENWALNIAGWAAICIALFPMDWDVNGTSPTAYAHYSSATTFFAMLFYVCIRCHGDTLCLMTDDENRSFSERPRFFKNAYHIVGWSMIIVPVSILVIFRIQPDIENSDLLYWLEVAGVYVFAIYWWIKSREITLLEQQ